MEAAEEEEKLHTMLRIAQFVLNRQTAAFRKELHEFLVGNAFEEVNQDTALSMSDIVSGIEDLLGLSEYPIQPVREAIDSMLNQGNLMRIPSIDGPKYALSPQKSKELRLLRSEYSNLRNTVESELTAKAKSRIGRISKSNRTKLMKSFDYVLGQVSAANLIHITGSATHAGFLDQTDLKSLKDFIEKAVTLYFRGEKREKIKTTIEEYIREQTEALASYLHGVSTASYVIQILHLDPECQGLTKEELHNITVYLDTNVIMHVLLDPDYLQGAIAELLLLLKQQGLRVRFTTETRDEFFAVMSASRRICDRLVIDKKRFEKIEPLLGSGFVKDFLRKRAVLPTLTVAGYFGRHEHVDRLMLTKYGVKMETDQYDELSRHPKFRSLTKHLSSITMKPQPVAAHDATHILLVQTKRKGQSCGLLGPRFWFLTLDFSLPIAENMLRTKGWVQSSIQPDQLTQMLSPVLSPDTTKVELPHLYSALFRSRLTDAGSLLNEDDLLKIQGPWMDYEDLGSEEIRDIIGNEHVRHIIRKLPAEGSPPENLSAAFEPVIIEMREKRKLDEKRVESEKRINIIKGVISLSLLVIGNLILVIIFLSFLDIMPAIGSYGVSVGIQAIIFKFFQRDIRRIFGMDHDSTDS